MLCEAATLREGLATLLATVWLLSCVSPHVLCDAVTLREGLATLLATVWLLSCVNSHVLCEAATFRECLATLLATVWLVCCVNFHVTCHMTMLTECLSTLFATVWLLSCVSSHVTCHMTMLTECLSTLFATVWLLSSVTSHESCQLSMFREGITTPLATVWSVSCHVLCQVVLLKECYVQLYSCIIACQVAKSTVEEVSFHTFLFVLSSVSRLLSLRILQTPCNCEALFLFEVTCYLCQELFRLSAVLAIRNGLNSLVKVLYFPQEGDHVP